MPQFVADSRRCKGSSRAERATPANYAVCCRKDSADNSKLYGPEDGPNLTKHSIRLSVNENDEQ
jgi:hypothetical protein